MDGVQNICLVVCRLTSVIVACQNYSNFTRKSGNEMIINNIHVMQHVNYYFGKNSTCCANI